MITDELVAVNTKMLSQNENKKLNIFASLKNKK